MLRASIKHLEDRPTKDSHHPACVRASRLASREVKKAKLHFEKKLAENIKKDSKSFFCLCTWEITGNKKARTPK